MKRTGSSSISERCCLSHATSVALTPSAVEMAHSVKGVPSGSKRSPFKLSDHGGRLQKLGCWGATELYGIVRDKLLHIC